MKKIRENVTLLFHENFFLSNLWKISWKRDVIVSRDFFSNLRKISGKCNVTVSRDFFLSNLWKINIYCGDWVSHFNYMKSDIGLLCSSALTTTLSWRVTRRREKGEWLMRSSTQVASQVTDDDSHIYIVVVLRREWLTYYLAFYFLLLRKTRINWWCVYGNWTDVCVIFCQEYGKCEVDTPLTPPFVTLR